MTNLEQQLCTNFNRKDNRDDNNLGNQRDNPLRNQPAMRFGAVLSVG